MSNLPEAFIAFESDVSAVVLPQAFTFPFQYEPHQLSKIAAAETQTYLENYTTLNHNFGLTPEQSGLVIGKMFGVLVVQAPDGTLGYLRAFSGKLGNENHHIGFVPPIFDMLTKQSYFLQEEEVLNRINKEIESLSDAENYKALQQQLQQVIAEKETAIAQKKAELKCEKNTRKTIRETQRKLLSAAAFEILEQDLIKQSLRDKHELKVLTEKLENQQQQLETELAEMNQAIDALKNERKEKSNALQDYLFHQYQFLNQAQETKNLLDIFKNTVFGRPPAAAGDCAAPKLLQYAFQYHLKPICMAEFWWGASPKSEIRKHKQFYPACTGKCEPILGHMLQGIETDKNPLLVNWAVDLDYKIVYQDEDVVVVNKPAEMLSVPGINIQDSVYTRIKKQFPLADGPLLVHRLDMSTSGLLLIALNKKAHKFLQAQFIKHTITKRYEALLNGVVEQQEGYIDIPLRGDLDDRPRQIVCYNHGKAARTQFKVIETTQNTTRIHFWPITGRTHQLRVHASHHLGLNCPIFGDDLYGSKSNRLHLHAAYLKFVHPTTKQNIEITSDPDF
ncbi:RNA pseudouridine synthase [Flavobacterium agricola]|uniref:RNA pseudouridine synthase n=1 Tax=Flavobacterium agricola TaxID=2870839 RepID=A0ABY6LYA4_9FLAO|nr:RluA family pseudouridine synthase [Flavobacterium agricola]UYW00369.1 RNA pseudouridine synthase [Flavobacterium agricola]